MKWDWPLRLDGPIHKTQFLEDFKRSARIESYGVKNLRFTNEEVFNTINEVLESISSEIKARS
ncbi:DUF559 domain-containing protein [Leeuwenhoekiella marinoflava]|uniref:DUF559 domain-containing protein n=1 Tax=Leeuwenhoekiella marinoflava TaxID=988 RepID=UPI0030033BCA